MTVDLPVHVTHAWFQGQVQDLIHNRLIYSVEPTSGWPYRRTCPGKIIAACCSKHIHRIIIGSCAADVVHSFLIQDCMKFIFQMFIELYFHGLHSFLGSTMSIQFAIYQPDFNATGEIWRNSSFIAAQGFLMVRGVRKL